MADFINTIDALGDDAVMDSIIDRTITEFKDDKLTSIGNYAFNQCTALTAVDLPGVVTANENAFSGCKKLATIQLPKLETTGNAMFLNCAATKLCLPSLKAVVTQMVRDSSVVVLDLPSCESIGGWAPFYGCKGKIKCIALRNNAVCTLSDVDKVFMSYVDGATIFDSGTCYVYVPSALIEDYKAATNWAAFSEFLRALEDYTVDGTVTGELDETKI